MLFIFAQLIPHPSRMFTLGTPICNPLATFAICCAPIIVQRNKVKAVNRLVR
jgi:hypothetical protein